MLSKNVNNKKCAPKLIFFNEKKIEKDSDNLWYRKLNLKVKRLGDFALFDTSPLTQFSKFNNFLWVCWFLGKNLPNFVPPVPKLHNLYCHRQHSLINLLDAANTIIFQDLSLSFLFSSETCLLLRESKKGKSVWTIWKKSNQIYKVWMFSGFLKIWNFTIIHMVFSNHSASQ